VPRVLARPPIAADLALWQAPWPICRLARAGAVVPAWIPLSIATDRPLATVVTGERSGREARKNDIRHVNRLGFSTRIATDAASYDRFRRELFEPYCTQRFGDLFVAPPPHTFRHARRHGWLLLWRASHPRLRRRSARRRTEGRRARRLLLPFASLRG